MKPRGIRPGPGSGDVTLPTLVAFLAVLSLASAALAAIETRGLRDERLRASMVASEYAMRLSGAIHDVTSPAYFLESLILAGDDGVFERVAAGLLERNGGIVNVALAPEGVIRRIAPLAGNEAALGLDLLADPDRSADAARARDSGLLTLSGPLEMVQGGRALVGRLPVFVPAGGGRQRFWGFVSVSAAFPEAIGPAGLASLVRSGYEYKLYRPSPSGSLDTVLETGSGPLPRPVDANVPVPNGSWTLEIAPGDGWFQASEALRDAAIALALAGVAAAVAHAAARVALSERRYRLFAEHASDVIWIMSVPELRLTYVSPSIERLTGYTPAEAMAQTIEQALDPESAGRVRAEVEARLDRFLAGDGSAAGGRSEVRQRCKDGSLRWIGMSVNFLPDESGRLVELLGISRDIEKDKRQELELERLAATDPLTGLTNRRRFFEEAARGLERARRHGGRVALLMIDLDHFKLVNDLHGHQVGDEALRSAAKAIDESARGEDLPARYGGEEFVVLMTEADTGSAVALAERIRSSIAALRVPAGDGEVSLTASIGVASADGGGMTLDDLVAAADRALYQAKERGRNRVALPD